jgi:hypothetical protein
MSPDRSFFRRPEEEIKSYNNLWKLYEIQTSEVDDPISLPVFTIAGQDQTVNCQ